MTPWLWESPMCQNIVMNLAILSELLGLFNQFLAKLSHFSSQSSLVAQVKLPNLRKYSHGLASLKAKGSYFGPKHLEQRTLIYINFIDRAPVKPMQHYSMSWRLQVTKTKVIMQAKFYMSISSGRLDTQALEWRVSTGCEPNF